MIENMGLSQIFPYLLTAALLGVNPAMSCGKRAIGNYTVGPDRNGHPVYVFTGEQTQ